MSSESKKKPPKRFYIACIAVTLVLLLLLLTVYLHQRAEVAPVYVLTVEGLNAESCADAQAMCRADNGKYIDFMQGMEDCSWVWCGENELYLVNPDALTVDTEAEQEGFTAVRFFDENGTEHRGYIIDPTAEPDELGRIVLDEAEEYSFDSVSMSVRVALRSGEISYENAVYLWEKGSSLVFAVGEDSYTAIDDNLVLFVDDGGVTRVCYILDTNLD